MSEMGRRRWDSCNNSRIILETCQSWNKYKHSKCHDRMHFSVARVVPSQFYKLMADVCWLRRAQSKETLERSQAWPINSPWMACVLLWSFEMLNASKWNAIKLKIWNTTLYSSRQFLWFQQTFHKDMSVQNKVESSKNYSHSTSKTSSLHQPTTQTSLLVHEWKQSVALECPKKLSRSPSWSGIHNTTTATEVHA